MLIISMYLQVDVLKKIYNIKSIIIFFFFNMFVECFIYKIID